MVLEPQVILYLDTPPSASTLKKLLKQLDLTPRELIRTSEQEYKDNHLNNGSLSDTQLIEMMVSFPRLIQRPIVVHNNQARIGRPPEAVLEIIK